MTNYSEQVFNQLMLYDYQIAFAESMTGGALTANFVQNAGASKLLSYSVVTYSVEAKHEHLNIPLILFDIHGVVSNVIAIEMAKNIREIAKADIGVGITGNAGPTSSENAQVGEIWVAIDYLGQVYSYHMQMKKSDRTEVIDQSVRIVYQMLGQLLKK